MFVNPRQVVCNGPVFSFTEVTITLAGCSTPVHMIADTGQPLHHGLEFLSLGSLGYFLLNPVNTMPYIMSVLCLTFINE